MARRGKGQRQTGRERERDSSREKGGEVKVTSIRFFFLFCLFVTFFFFCCVDVDCTALQTDGYVHLIEAHPCCSGNEILAITDCIYEALGVRRVDLQDAARVSVSGLFSAVYMWCTCV